MKSVLWPEISSLSLSFSLSRDRDGSQAEPGGGGGWLQEWWLDDDLEEEKEEVELIGTQIKPEQISSVHRARA